MKMIDVDTIANSTNPHELSMWAVDGDVLDREMVAYNPATPTHVLEVLAQEESVLVKAGVAANPNTPIFILENLYKVADEIDHSLSTNPHTPMWILSELCASPHEGIAHSAMKVVGL